ncbi:hypothetical protein GYA19_06230, partial [Candidatus Beckwithbacteria bacterium]|nr:hypothetical protein [Candidatus Beckwithbacteria bacterium]
MAEDPNLQKTDTPIQVAKPETVQSQAPAAASQLEVKKTETPEMKQVENKEVKLETKTEEVKSEVTSETKVEEVKIEEPKKEEIKAEETKAVESKKEEVKVEEVKAEEPKKEAKVEVKKTEKVELKNEVDQAVSELVEEIHEIATEFKQINTTPLKVEQPVVPSNPVNAVSTNAPVVTAGEQVKTEVPTPKPAETTPVVATAPVAPTPEVKPADADNVVASPEEQAIIDNLMKEVGNIQPAATQPVKTSLFAKIFAKFKKEKKEDAAVKVEGNQDQAKQKKLPKGLKIALLVLGIILVITLILGGLAFFTVKPIISKAQKTATLGQEAYTLIKQQNLTEGKAKLLEAKNSLTDTQNAYNKTAWMKFIPVISKYREDGEDGLKAGMAGIEAGEILLDAVIPYADVLGLTGEGTFMGGTVEDRVVKMVETLEKIVP